MPLVKKTAPVVTAEKIATAKAADASPRKDKSKTDSYLVVDVLDLNGKVIGQETLNKDIFACPAPASLLAQALRVFTFNQRQGTANAKDRSEVKGGGRKPWRQKGTGRARQGSIRSPQWKGGGVVHGPRPKDWGLDLSKKLRQKALLGALTLKAQDKEIVLLKELTVKDGRTKDFLTTMAKLPLPKEKRSLVILPEKDEMVLRSVRNLKNASVETVANINTLQIVSAHQLLLTKDAVAKMESFLLRKDTN